jgi:hypothetical protein
MEPRRDRARAQLAAGRNDVQTRTSNCLRPMPRRWRGAAECWPGQWRITLPDAAWRGRPGSRGREPLDLQLAPAIADLAWPRQTPVLVLDEPTMGPDTAIRAAGIACELTRVGPCRYQP